MVDEFLEKKEVIEEEYEMDEELDPVSQGFMKGWLKAGKPDKKDESDIFGEEE